MHLDKFLNCIKANIPIKDRITTYKGKQYKSSRITICSKKMCMDLSDKGCTPRKTYTIKFPNKNIVPSNLIKDFIRGYFDGDGCIYTNAENKRIELVVTGMPDMLDGISDFLIKEKVLRVRPKLYKDKRSKASSMYIYGRDSIKEILDYLYNGSSMFLDRKYNKYNLFYKDYFYQNNKRGIYFDRNSKKFIVTISVNNNRKLVGRFDSFEDALICRKNAEIEKMNLLNSRLNQ